MLTLLPLLLGDHDRHLVRLEQGLGVRLSCRGNRVAITGDASRVDAAQAVLEDEGLPYAMRPALTIRMENQPGSGAATFRKLADAGVNADLLLPVRVSDELFFAGICVDDQDKARDALGAQVVPGSLAS